MSHRILIFGSGQRERPIIKLSEDAEGFDNPAKPKCALWIWAQTRDDAAGLEEPEWGKEQPNIAFSHFFKGIDIDVRGHAGAIGLRFSASQGSSLLDCKVLAEGAFAGFSDCPGQGGGTYNIETVGGRFGITLDAQSRFPILTGCKFTGQSVACIGYHTSTQVPTLLVGCLLEPAAEMAVDFTRPAQYAGISLVDCIVSMRRGGVVVGTRRPANVLLESSFVRGTRSITSTSQALAAPDGWTHVELFSSTTPGGVHFVDGRRSQDEIFKTQSADQTPTFAAVRAKHYRAVPSFDEADVVNVRDFGILAKARRMILPRFAKRSPPPTRCLSPKARSS